jgi:hypothetical protein
MASKRKVMAVNDDAVEIVMAATMMRSLVFINGAVLESTRYFMRAMAPALSVVTGFSTFK